MRKGIAIVGALVLLLAAAGTSHAVLLSDLLNGGSVTAGDKLFDNWTLIDHTASDGRAFNAGNINVSAHNDGGMNPGPGLGFDVFNNELQVTGDGIFAFVDLQFGFRVSVLDQTLAITDNSLNLTGWNLGWTADGSNDFGIYINETIGSAPLGNDLGVKDVERSLLNDVSTRNLSASAIFAPQSEIWVTKNILVWSVDTTDSAELVHFNQRFSQSPVGVPEPGMLALLALGGIALLRFRRS